jgi:hypothetical protein
MNEQTPSIWMPSLIAGGVFGVLSGMPLIGALNCACCALVIGCGVLAAFLYSRSCREAGVGFRPGRGALVGLAAGLFHALAATVISTIANLIVGDFERSLEQMQQFMPPDPEAAEAVERMVEIMESLGPIGMFFIGLIFWVVLSSIFATIGGLIGGALFKVEIEPEAPLPGTPPPPPIG